MVLAVRDAEAVGGYVLYRRMGVRKSAPNEVNEPTRLGQNLER